LIDAKLDHFSQSFQSNNPQRPEGSIFGCESPAQNKREIKEELKREMSLIKSAKDQWEAIKNDKKNLFP
jgi:hypothetical protein